MRPPWLSGLRLPCAFVGVWLLVQWSLLSSYGISWDEPLHRTWAQMILAGQTELPGHGIEYGPLYYLLNYGAGEFLVMLGLPTIPAIHALTVATAAAGLLCTFLLARRFFGEAAAWWSLLFLAFYPPLIAHAHYNPKDIPLLAAGTCSMLAAAWARETRTFAAWAVAGACIGLALALKFTALLLLPAAAALLLPPLYRERRWSLALAAGVSALVTLILAWPTAWTEPLRIIQALRFFAAGDFWSGSVLYLGSVEPARALPWHYVPVHLFLSLPLLTMFAIFLGLFFLLRRKNAATAALLLWILVPLAVSLRTDFARYDGMRQFFFMIPALAIVAGLGAEQSVRRWGRGGAMIAAAALTLLLVGEIVRVHPYEGAYINEAGRMFIPPPLEDQIDWDYWGVSEAEGAAWLNEHAREGASVCAPLAPHLLAFYEWRPDLRLGCEPLEYVMVFSRFGMLPPQARLPADRAVFRVSRYGSDLLRVYDLTR